VGDHPDTDDNTSDDGGTKRNRSYQGVVQRREENGELYGYISGWQ